MLAKMTQLFSLKKFLSLCFLLMCLSCLQAFALDPTSSYGKTIKEKISQGLEKISKQAKSYGKDVKKFSQKTKSYEKGVKSFEQKEKFYGESAKTIHDKVASYGKAVRHFRERIRPFPHFLDLAIGSNLLPSIYPLKLAIIPPILSLHVRYRREKWGSTKWPVIFSAHYEWDFNSSSPDRIEKVYALIGTRVPRSHDLNKVHVDFLAGTSFFIKYPEKDFSPYIPIELRLLFTYILSPAHKTARIYVQGGLKSEIIFRENTEYQFGLVIRIGLDLYI